MKTFDIIPFNLQNIGSEPFRRNPDYYKTFSFSESGWVAKLHNKDIENLESVGLFKPFVNLTDYNILLLRKDLFATTVSLCISKIKTDDTTMMTYQLKLV